MEESWIYWSLKTKKVPASDASGDVSKRMSPDDLRVTEKLKVLPYIIFIANIKSSKLYTFLRLYKVTSLQIDAGKLTSSNLPTRN